MPGPSLRRVWVHVWPNAGWPCGSDRAFCREGLSSPTVERGQLVLLPVSTVVFYLQQDLFSKSSLKWLCLSSLLLYEFKKTKQNNETKNQTPTTINTKTLTHQTLAACVTHKPHRYSVKKLILLRTIHSTRDRKVAVVYEHATCPRVAHSQVLPKKSRSYSNMAQDCKADHSFCLHCIQSTKGNTKKNWC